FRIRNHGASAPCLQNMEISGRWRNRLHVEARARQQVTPRRFVTLLAAGIDQHVKVREQSRGRFICPWKYSLDNKEERSLVHYFLTVAQNTRSVTIIPVVKDGRENIKCAA